MRLVRSVQTSVILLVGIAYTGAAVAQQFEQVSLRNIEKNTVLMRQYEPSWPVPIVGVTPALAQVFRFSYARQITPTGVPVNNYLNGKGLCVVSSNRTEIDLSLPSYQEHNSAAIDGFGDTGVNVKYRLFSGNEQHGNYVLTLMGTHTFATGSAKNGAPASSNGLMMLAGKGFGSRFNVQSGFGATLPTQLVSATGRPLALNSVFQAHLTRRIWLDVESNSTFFKGGPNDSKKQTFLTPGVILVGGRPGFLGPKSPLFVFDTAMQIATTHYHATNHNLLLDLKMAF